MLIILMKINQLLSEDVVQANYFKKHSSSHHPSFLLCKLTPVESMHSFQAQEVTTVGCNENIMNRILP
jgi:hypothetical protein